MSAPLLDYNDSPSRKAAKKLIKEHLNFQVENYPNRKAKGVDLWVQTKEGKTIFFEVECRSARSTKGWGRGVEYSLDNYTIPFRKHDIGEYAREGKEIYYIIISEDYKAGGIIPPDVLAKYIDKTNVIVKRNAYEANAQDWDKFYNIPSTEIAWVNIG